MSVTTRVAPSPTGRLHVGHAWSAMLSHDLARTHGGRCVLRIEDIDTARCRPEYVAGILDDLAWLGLAFDGDVVVQSQRFDAHAAALGQLRQLGVVYRCACTRAEIAASASAPHGRIAAYPGTCRIHAVPADDPRPIAWRLDLQRAVAMTGALCWRDAHVGEVAVDTAAGDVVVARKGLGVAYHLAVVVDDAAAGVSDIVRGCDLFTATHVQRVLQALLGLPSPNYHHHALVVGDDGQRLAKRTPGATLADLRAAGHDGRVLLGDLRRGALPVGFTFDAS